MTHSRKQEPIIAFKPMIAEDLPFLLSVRNQVKDNLHDQNEFTLDEATAWWQITDSRYWIILRGEQQVGYFRVKRISGETWQIGADIDPVFQRQGIAGRAYPHFVREVLLPLGVTTLELRVLKKNSVAFNLYLKLGFDVAEETDTDYRMIQSAKPFITRRT